MSAPGISEALTPAEQRRNIVVFAGCTALTYLGAPVMYVGVMHAGLGNRLGMSASIANLPGSFYFFTTFVPVLVAWRFPDVAVLRRNLAGCYVAMAATLALVGANLALPTPPWMQFGGVMMQALVCGAAAPTATGLLWEMIGRGVDESRRGLTLGLGFGLGPLGAVTGSYLQMALVGGKFFAYELAGLAYPWSYTGLYALGATAMAISAALASRCIVRAPVETTPPRESSSDAPAKGLPAILARLFEDFLTNRTLALAAAATILLYMGNMIPSNIALYAKYVLGGDPDQYGGPQNMLRFGCKFAAGVCLGWLLSKTSPRAGMLATGGLYLLTMCWAMAATGQAYLVTAGLYGAGELVGVYAPNYILSASRRRHLRANMAIVQLLMMPTSPAGFFYGLIAEQVGSRYADTLGEHAAQALGYRVSFGVCAASISAGLALVWFLLPARPTLDEGKG